MTVAGRAPLAITMGDPAGVGAEVILKAAASVARRSDPPRIVVVGNLDAMRFAARKLGGVPEPHKWNPREELVSLQRGLPVLNVGELSRHAMHPGRGTVEGGDNAYNYIVEAVRMVQRGEAAALVTAPINKEWLNRAGHRFPGHSELLAKLTRTKLWRMMFAGDRLRLALVTVHMGLGKVPRAITEKSVLDTIRLLHAHLRDRLGIVHPRLGVLGFNPHAGEGGLFGNEETRAIEPAIRAARRERIGAYGPLAPDTAFIRRNGAFDFDAAVAMYHDQGLIALKTLEFERAVNITLGLPFVRTSPDHGTAYDIAGQSIASAESMIAAIDHAWRAVTGRSTAARRAA
jgi:4-hydroxythreonine-4-phosphate dehydrogenase